jgi:hypothetical protein
VQLLRPDRPLNAREFLEHITAYLDSEIALNRDPSHVFELHRSAFDKIIDKFELQRDALQAVKSGYDSLIVEFRNSVNSLSPSGNSPAAPVLGFQIDMEGAQAKNEHKRLQLKETVLTLHTLIPSIQSEIASLKDEVKQMKQTVAERMADEQARQSALIEARTQFAALNGRLRKYRAKSARATAALAATTAQCERAQRAMLARLEGIYRRGCEIDDAREALSALRGRESRLERRDRPDKGAECESLRAEVDRLRREAQRERDEGGRIAEALGRMRKRQK